MLLVAFIQVASLGADQFSLGITEPPSSAMVDRILVWISGHACEGSESESESSASESSAEENIPLSVSVSRVECERGVSGGRTMLSERR